MLVVAWPARKNRQSNPYNYRLSMALEEQAGVEIRELTAASLLARQRPDILHVHWPDVFLATGHGLQFWARLATLLCLAAITRVRHIPIVWTAHNFRRQGQANADRLEKYFWPFFLKWIDAYVFMNEASREQIQSDELYIEKPNEIIPLGSYAPDNVPPHSLPSGPPSVLAFGAVARYKNLHQVVTALAEADPGDIRVTIAGKESRTAPDLRLNQAIDDLPEEHAKYFTRVNEFVSDSDLETLLCRSDLTIIPYGNALNSAVAMTALGYNCPILCVNTAPFRELAASVGVDWVRLYTPPLDGDTLAAHGLAARALRATGHQPDLSQHQWTDIAHRTVMFYERLIDVHS